MTGASLTGRSPAGLHPSDAAGARTAGPPERFLLGPASIIIIQGRMMPKLKQGHTRKTTKKYPRFTAGPLRGQYVHRVVAAALLGRKLDRSEQVDHRDRDKLNCWFTNLIIRGESDHGWVSAKQAWYMKQRDGKLKQEWDEFMAAKDEEQQVAICQTKTSPSKRSSRSQPTQ